jgi:hypothetical protein
MIKEIVKIEIKNQNLTFGDRERFINTEIQKVIDSYNKRGFNVINHSLQNKSANFATVNFDLVEMPR